MCWKRVFRNLQARSLSSEYQKTQFHMKYLYLHDTEYTVAVVILLPWQHYYQSYDGSRVSMATAEVMRFIVYRSQLRCYPGLQFGLLRHQRTICSATVNYHIFADLISQKGFSTCVLSLQMKQFCGILVIHWKHLSHVSWICTEKVIEKIKQFSNISRYTVTEQVVLTSTLSTEIITYCITVSILHVCCMR